MEEMKKYSEWRPIFEKLNDVRVLDDDGGMQVERDGKTDSLMSRKEAWNYFLHNTISGITTKNIEMSKAIEYEIKGLKCDNPECDFVDLEIPFSEYESYVNKPCPKCGQPLLTEEDYGSAMLVTRMVDNLNKYLPPTPEGAKIGHMFMQMKGDGSVEFENSSDVGGNTVKCDKCENFNNMMGMLIMGIECKRCVQCISTEECLTKKSIEED